eukprot:scaffold7653_cov120-Isochrysis_galbana.AAC.4
MYVCSIYAPPPKWRASGGGTNSAVGSWVWVISDDSGNGGKAGNGGQEMFVGELLPLPPSRLLPPCPSVLTL